MDCIKAQKLIRPYLKGQLSDRELAAFLDHVEGCTECHDELEIYFSIYQTLGEETDDGDYNFTKKLNRKIEKSREYLKWRAVYRNFRIAVIAGAELVFLAAVSGLVRGDLEKIRSRVEKAGQVETEAVTETELLSEEEEWAEDKEG